MSTQIVLSQADSRPMYRQIMDEISRRVTLGDWAPGFRLPSIRELASKLQVSVITIKRAYMELERAGVIVTRQGLGSFVNEEVDLEKARTEELHRCLEEAAGLAAQLGLSHGELVWLLERHSKVPGSLHR